MFYSALEQPLALPKLGQRLMGLRRVHDRDRFPVDQLERSTKLTLRPLERAAGEAAGDTAAEVVAGADDEYAAVFRGVVHARTVDRGSVAAR